MYDTASTASPDLHITQECTTPQVRHRQTYTYLKKVRHRKYGIARLIHTSRKYDTASTASRDLHIPQESMTPQVRHRPTYTYLKKVLTPQVRHRPTYTYLKKVRHRKYGIARFIHTSRKYDTASTASPDLHIPEESTTP